MFELRRIFEFERMFKLIIISWPFHTFVLLGARLLNKTPIRVNRSFGKKFTLLSCASKSELELGGGVTHNIYQINKTHFKSKLHISRYVSQLSITENYSR